MTAAERLVVSSSYSPNTQFEVEVVEPRVGTKPPKIDCPGDGKNCSHRSHFHSATICTLMSGTGDVAIYLCGKNDEDEE